MTWKEELPEDLRDTPIVKEAKDIASLAKQAVDFQRMLGNSLRVPGEGAGENEWKEFHEKAARAGLVARDRFTEIVRPEKPEHYALKKVPEDVAELGLAQSDVDAWKARAHVLGLSKEQFAEWAETQIAERRAAAKDRAERFRAADESLKQEWGQAFEQRKALALAAAKRFGGDTLVQALGNNPDPLVLRALGEIGKQFEEKGMGDLTPRPNFAETRQEAQLKLDEIMRNPEHPYNRPQMAVGRAAKDAAIAEVMRLRALAMGQKPSRDFMFEEAG
jgi:hypothetical protein